MALDYELVLRFEDKNQRFTYSDREVMLYAIGVGFGRTATNPDELPFVYEKNLKVLPSFASVMAHGCFNVRKLGVNYSQILHGEFSLEFAQPLPPQADLLVDVSVPGLWDKGVQKGALLQMQADVRDAKDDAPLCTIRTGYFCRADGGFLKADQREINEAPVPHKLPSRAADISVDVQTRADQPLLYRLSGDRNPLHADPEVARAAGFQQPIMHGLCTYGICCGALVRTVLDHDPSRIRTLGVRFSQPVYPGETITVEMWKDGDLISFRALVRGRDVVIINNGYCQLNAQ